MPEAERFLDPTGAAVEAAILVALKVCPISVLVYAVFADVREIFNLILASVRVLDDKACKDKNKAAYFPHQTI